MTAALSEVDADPRGAATPDDYAEQTGWRLHLGIARPTTAGEAVLDGSLRMKSQESVIVSPFGPAFDQTTDTRLATLSFTPRFRFGGAADGIAGLDYAYSDYDQVAWAGAGTVPRHRYDLKQHSLAGYAQAERPLSAATRLSAGARVQGSWFTGGDLLDPDAVVDFQGVPFDGHRESQRIADTQWAAHLGAEHRTGPRLAWFGRLGRSFRAPTVDERVLSSAAFDSFALATQTSWDAELGARWSDGRHAASVTAWQMNLRDELHFNAGTFLNENLPPTRRRRTGGKRARRPGAGAPARPERGVGPGAVPGRRQLRPRRALGGGLDRRSGAPLGKRWTTGS